MMNQSDIISLYQKIYLVRKCEETICNQYSYDQMKTPVHLSIGAEAIAAAVLQALPEESKIFGTYRNHALYLIRTGDVNGFFAEMYGRQRGVASGKAGSMHLACPEKNFLLTSAVVATTIPVAVGAALANQYQNKEDVVAVFFGDGAVEEGVFWESLNFASLKKLRIIFVCEDNDLAIHTYGSTRQGYRSLSEAVKGFNCSYTKIDGWNPVKVFEGAHLELEKMKIENQPCIMHLPYFRYAQHVGVSDDFTAAYRVKPDKQYFELHDPLLCAEKILRDWNVDENEQAGIRNEIDQRILEAVKKAEQASFSDEASLYDGVYCK
jgi:TPP-dependent pyruvate/acetoin dehydrogenase alpha subunit